MFRIFACLDDFFDECFEYCVSVLQNQTTVSNFWRVGCDFERMFHTFRLICRRMNEGRGAPLIHLRQRWCMHLAFDMPGQMLYHSGTESIKFRLWRCLAECAPTLSQKTDLLSESPVWEKVWGAQKFLRHFVLKSLFQPNFVQN